MLFVGNNQMEDHICDARTYTCQPVKGKNMEEVVGEVYYPFAFSFLVLLSACLPDCLPPPPLVAPN